MLNSCGSKEKRYKMICSSSSEDEEEDDIDAYANNNQGNKLPVPNGNVTRWARSLDIDFNSSY